LGIWGMTLFSKPETRDLDKWSRGVIHVLRDPKGQHYFGEFLKGFEDYDKIRELWVRLDELLLRQEPVGQNEAQEIVGEAEHYLPMTPHDVSELRDAIVSQNKDKIREVQGRAIDKLNGVHDGFIEHVKKSK